MSETPNIFLQYQRNWLNDKSPVKFAEKSRQIGWTWMQAMEDLTDIGLRNVAQRSYLTSKDQSSIELYIDYLKFHGKAISLALEDIGEELIDVDADVSARCVRLKNGNKIYGLSSSPGAVRGKNGKIVIDEFAWHKKAGDLWDAAKPATTWGYPIRVFSSHNGAGSLFYNQTQEIREGKFKASLHTITLYDAVRAGMLDKIKRRKTSIEEQNEWIQEQLNSSRGKKNIQWVAPDGTVFMTSQAGAQEYLCIAVDESTAFLTYDLIDSCTQQNILKALESTSGDLYVGMDIGRVKNLTIIWVVEVVGDMLFTRALIALEKTKFKIQKENLRKVLKHPKCRRCCIDQTGIGMQLAEEMTEEFGEQMVEGVTFTAQVKDVLASGLKGSMEDLRFIIPDQPEVRDEFHSVQKETTAAGNVRFVAEESDEGAHADRFWAAALARFAYTSKPYVPFSMVGSGNTTWTQSNGIWTPSR